MIVNTATGCGFTPQYEGLQKIYDEYKEKGFNTTGDDIKWNFTKFLVDKNGKVVARFAPTYGPEEIEEAIKNLLDEK